MPVSAAGERRPLVIVTRPALLAAAGLLAAVVALALFAPGHSRAPPLAPLVQQRLLRFDDRADGAVTVDDAATGARIDVVVGQQGFLRQTMRGLAVVREAAGYGQMAPFELSYYADHRLILRDPVTSREIELEAFGPTNEAVFARYLPGAGSAGLDVAGAGSAGLDTARSSGDTVR